MLEILRAESGELLEQARMLFAEYGQTTEIYSSYPDFDEELARLPRPFISPDGCLLVAMFDGQAAGCVALRNLSDGVCEMKRLYVKPEFRGHKIGKALAEAVIEEGRRLGYGTMRLDTLKTMLSAQNLYAALGFKVIAPYFYKPEEESVFMELTL
jgi:ribosomal protein S18 acetylase RimI-like enzyme